MTKIRFSRPVAGEVKLEVYTLLGRDVATLFDDMKSPGVYIIDFNGAALPAGIYFYKIQTKEFQAIKKMSRIE